jgi:hypothetical protein
VSRIQIFHVASLDNVLRRPCPIVVDKPQIPLQEARFGVILRGDFPHIARHLKSTTIGRSGPGWTASDLFSSPPCFGGGGAGRRFSASCRGRILVEAVAFAAAFVGRAPTAAAAASTNVVLLSFEGVRDDSPVGAYYNGGGGGPAKAYGNAFGPAVPWLR